MTEDMEGLFALIVFILVIVGITGVSRRVQQRPKRQSRRAVPQAAPAPTAFAPRNAASREGEDPCHQAMFPPVRPVSAPAPAVAPRTAEQPEPEPTMEPDENREEAQELLRGVVLSEILQRRPPIGRRRA